MSHLIPSLSSHAAALFHPDEDEMPASQDWRITPWVLVEEALGKGGAAQDGGRVNPQWEEEVREMFR